MKYWIKLILIFVFLFTGTCRFDKEKSSFPAIKNKLTARKTAKKLKKIFQNFNADSCFKNAIVAYCIINENTEEVLAAYNQDLSLIPASTLKILTTGAALETFGSDKKFMTDLEYDGTIKKGVLNGNIYINGGGDPALGSKFFEHHYGDFIDVWAKKIKSLGITKIKGRIIADAQFFDTETAPTTWFWGDLNTDYGTPAHGISIFDNLMNIKIDVAQKGIYKPDSASLSPFYPNLKIENLLEIQKKNSFSVYFLGPPYAETIRIKGKVPAWKSKFKRTASIPDPPYLLAYLLHQKLKSYNVKIQEKPTTIRRLKQKNILIESERKTFYTTFSPPLSQIVRITNTYSHNLFAEHLLLHLGNEIYGKADTYSGAVAVKRFWASAGINVNGLNLGDGCGISRFNTLTAQQLVDALLYMKKNSQNRAVFFQSLAVSGESGTLRTFCRKSILYKKIRGKSGSMTRVRSYAGCFENQKKQKVIFAFIINHYNCRSSDIKKKIEQALIDLVICLDTP